MSGLLGTLDMGNRALQTQMKGLELTGHNLANVNNPGFSRQRMEVDATYQLEAGQQSRGTGVALQSIQQIRDQILDAQIRSEKSVTGFLESKMTGLEYMQAGLGSVMDVFSQDGQLTGGANGMTALFNDFTSKLHEVANDPSSRSARQSFLDAAQNLTGKIQETSSQAQKLQIRLDDEIKTLTGESNELIAQLAELNQSIQKVERGGLKTANELRDQRVEILEQLGTLMPLEISTAENGKMLVQSGATILIEGENVLNTLLIEPLPEGGLILNWNNDETPFKPQEGRFGGLFDLKSGALNELQVQNDTLARGLMEIFNGIHSKGFAKDGSTGRNLFIGTDAVSLEVDPAILQDPNLLQASSRPDEAGNNEIIQKMITAMSDKQAQLDGRNFVEVHADMVSDLGLSIKNTQRALEDQQSLETLMQKQRESISGVSIDEEMTQLVKYQRAFEASAKLIGIVDEMLGTVLSMSR